MAVAPHNVDNWFGSAYDAMVPPQHRERFQAIRQDLRNTALDIMRYTNGGADQTSAIKRLRDSMMFTMFCFIEAK